MAYGEVIKLIQKDGWRLTRQTGHKQYTHPTKRGVVSIARKPLSAVVPPGTLKSILLAAGLTEEGEQR